MRSQGPAKRAADDAGSDRRTRSQVAALKDRAGAKVLILGGGINGVGTFRDLALQGVDVALVERGDYCQGASGASSHMIHGGIRYLENGEFRLVKESVQERNRLLRIAPHYVKPLRTTIPIHSTFSGILAAPLRFLTHKQGKATERGAFLIKIGLSLYDSFSRDGGSVPRHRFVGRKKALADLPDLDPAVKYTATYFDASVHNPERLTLDVLRDGQAAGDHARAANYVSAVDFSDGRVTLRDEITGETFDFAADVVVNTTGAWVDATNAALAAPSSFMGGTKGSHIVLDHPGLLAACNGRELFFEHTDGRIVLIYPMGDRVLVGTTDVDADMRTEPVCTEAEIDYFFDLIGHVFPKVPVTRDSIVYSFSGVRPLPRHDETAPGFVSRDYRIERRDTATSDGSVTTLSLVGGKWTTFRALAEHMSRDVLAALGRERTVSTTALPIGGGADFPATDEAAARWAREHARDGVDAARAALLLQRYGTRAADVIDYLAARDDRPLNSTDELSTGEIAYMAAHEQVGRLVDVLIRRTSLAFRGLVTDELLDELAGVLGAELGWDQEQTAAQGAEARRILHDRHGVTLHGVLA